MKHLLALRDRCSWPSIYYHTVDKLIQAIESPIILEVGVAYGLHGEHILNKFPDSIYYGVDPYYFGYDESDSFGYEVHNQYQMCTPQESFDQLFKDVSNSLRSKFKYRSFLIRSSLKYCLTALPKNMINFIFIDGDHRYSAVRMDLMCAKNLISKNGIIAGDDYNWPEVKKAVDDFANEIGKKVNVLKNANGHMTWYLEILH